MSTIEKEKQAAETEKLTRAYDKIADTIDFELSRFDKKEQILKLTSCIRAFLDIKEKDSRGYK